MKHEHMEIVKGKDDLQKGKKKTTKKKPSLLKQMQQLHRTICKTDNH